MTILDASDVRVAITQMLRDGLHTQIELFPKLNKEFVMLLTELRYTPREDLRRKLVTADELSSIFARHGALP
jgi:hypothetical protein